MSGLCRGLLRLGLAGLLLAALPATARAGTGKAAQPPRRLVSLAPSLTEIVFALGAGDRLVGVTSVCDYPPAAQRLPKVGGMVDGGIDLERVLALEPDLVLAIGSGQERAVDALRRLGLRVEVVSSHTFDDVFGATTRLGGLLGREAAAKSLTESLRRRVERIRKAVAPLPRERRVRVFYEVWNRPLMTASRDTLIGQIIEFAGGTNIFGDVAGRFVQVSPEAVVKRDPQVILAPDYHDERVRLETVAEMPGFAGLEAVRRGRIVILPGDVVSRAGPRIADALELVAHALHPELFPAPTAVRP